jgi:hypothetical protein
MAGFSCKEKERIFNGNIVIIEEPAASDNLYGSELKLDGIYTGGISVYDSLINFPSSKYPDYYIYVFNTETGKYINSAIRKGVGPNELISINYSEQYCIDSNICLWCYDVNKGECVLADLLNNSFKKRIKLSALKNEREYPFGWIFVLNDSLLLASNQGEDLYDEGNLNPPIYRIYNYHTGEVLRIYEPYNGFRYNTKIMPAFSLYSQDRIKPDKTRLAEGMNCLRQINIMELETGKVTGYRIKGSPDFDVLREGSSYNYVAYYTHICVDNDLIYGILNSNNEKTAVDVFDWEGNFKKKLLLDKKMANVTTISLDPVNKYLYILTLGEEEEEVYRYDVGYLYPNKYNANRDYLK